MTHFNKEAVNDILKELLRLDLHEEAKKFLFGFYDGMENSTQMAEEEAPPPSTVIIEELVEESEPETPGSKANLTKETPGRKTDGQEQEKQPGQNMEGQAPQTPPEEEQETNGWTKTLTKLEECFQRLEKNELEERTLLKEFKDLYMSNPEGRPQHAKEWKGQVKDRLAELDMLTQHRKELANKRKAQEEENKKLDKAIQEARQRRILLEEAAQAQKAEARRIETELQQARVQEMFAERERQQREAKRAYHKDEIPRCFVCGTPGVKKSRNCPNWRTHTLYPERTYKK